MLVDGQWLVSHVNGVVNSHKPPLFFWLIALISMPMGAVNEWTARLPSALAALGTLWLILRLGRRWYGPKSAALSGIILVTAFMFWEKARWSQIDSLLCFLIWLALSAFDQFRTSGTGGRRAGLVFWLACGLATLAKGPVGFLIPFGIVLVTLAWDRALGKWRQFAPVSGPLVFFGVTGTWVAAVSFWGPEGYTIWGALREHFVDRGIHGMHHVQPFWYYLERLPSSILPWAGLLPGVVFWAWKRQAIGTDRIAIVTCTFVFLFFSISTEKRDLYMLPAFPAWALLMGGMVGAVGRTLDSERVEPLINKRWVILGHGIVIGILLLGAVALPIAGRKFNEVPYWGTVFLFRSFNAYGYWD
jgi:4-amino-4-deoxy-L-arabinose transferase-like glycosyltransferase